MDISQPPDLNNNPVNPRIRAYLKALEIFKKNPLEESCLGLSRQDILALIQSYIDQHAPDLKINLLRNSDLSLSGKNIRNDSVSFGNQIGAAINYLTSVMRFPENQTGINFSNTTVPVDIINRAVKTWEEEVIKNFGEEEIGRGYFWKANTSRALPFRKKWEEENDAGKILSRNILLSRSEKLHKELEEERREKEIRIWEQIGESLDKNIKNIAPIATSPHLNKIQNVVIDAINDTSGEEEFWQDASISLYRPLERKTIGKFSPEEREEKINQAYVEKIKNRASQDPDLVSFAEDEQTIRQIVLALPQLTQRSYLKFVDKYVPKIDPNLSPAQQATISFQAREQIGSLLFGKLTLEAERATSGVATKLKDRQQRIGDAVAETYFELQAKGLNVANLSPAEINTLLYQKLDKKLRLPVSRNNDFDISGEAKQIAVFEGQIVATRGEDTEELHSLPIPGMIFLDKLARTQIVANDDIFNMLKVQTVEEVIKKYSPTFSQLLHLEGEEHKPLSIEETILVGKYLQGYQQIVQKHGFVAKLANWNAKLYSMQYPTIRGTKIQIPIPTAQIWGYTRYFLQMSFSDPSIAPLAGVMLSWNLVKGTVGYNIKTKVFVRAIDGVFKTVPGLNRVSLLKNLLYVREHGIAIVTALHPLHAGKAFLKETGLKLLQKTANKARVWSARVLGKEATEKILAALAKSLVGRLIATGGIPVIGQIINLLGFMWDFIFPEWLKKAIKLGFGLTAGILAWILTSIAGLVGPLALIGLVAGLVFGGLVGAAVGFAIGFVAQTFMWIITGNLTWLPTILHGLVGTLGQWGASLGQAIGGAIKSGAFGLFPVTQMAFAATATVAGAGVATFVSAVIITSMVWTPAVFQAVPGGLIASDFTVNKSVVVIPSSNCPNFPKCENTVTDQSNKTEFEYTIEITVADGKQISNIQVEDKIAVIAQGPNITSPPTINKYEIPVIIPPDQYGAIVLPDSSGNNTAIIKYKVNFQDAKYQNSAVFNLVTVTANGQKATNGTTFSIGTPPPSDCPVLLGTINCASLGGGFNGCQHGSDSYWKDVGATCDYQVPYLTGTMGNSVPYANATLCTSQTPLAEDYGFALDIGPGVNSIVRFPTVYGENLTWVRQGGEESNNKGAWGYGGFYGATGKDYSYRIYVTHLTTGISAGGESGEVLGKMCDKSAGECSIGMHVHLEIQQINNATGEKRTLRPDFMCSY